MIYIGRVADMSSEYDENWMIVRAPEEIPYYAKHVPILSPLPDLFSQYKAALANGEFNKQWFEEVYVPRFTYDLANNPDALKVLTELCDLGQEKNMYLCCYCEDEKLCHRSIVSGILLGMGASIITEDSYRRYFLLLSKAIEKSI